MNGKLSPYFKRAPKLPTRASDLTAEHHRFIALTLATALALGHHDPGCGAIAEFVSTRLKPYAKLLPWLRQPLNLILDVHSDGDPELWHPSIQMGWYCSRKQREIARRLRRQPLTRRRLKERRASLAELRERDQEASRRRREEHRSLMRSMRSMRKDMRLIFGRKRRSSASAA